MESIRISRLLKEQILEHVENLIPEEACGLLGGINGEVLSVLPVENELHSPIKFRMAASEQIQSFLSIESQGLVVIGIYHSHPKGQDFPSDSDIKEHAYPESASFICSKMAGIWNLHAFWIREGQVQEIELIYH